MFGWDKMFDFNRDGKLNWFERSMQFAFWDTMRKKEEQDEYSDTYYDLDDDDLYEPEDDLQEQDEYFDNADCDYLCEQEADLPNINELAMYNTAIQRFIKILKLKLINDLALLKPTPQQPKPDNSWKNPYRQLAAEYEVPIDRFSDENEFCDALEKSKARWISACEQGKEFGLNPQNYKNKKLYRKALEKRKRAKK